jgi:hypothetical protein
LRRKTGGVGADGGRKLFSGNAARVHDAGDDCRYWSRDVDAEASRAQVKASEACATFDQWSALVDRRLGSTLARRQITTVLRRSEDPGVSRRPTAISRDFGAILTQDTRPSPDP